MFGHFTTLCMKELTSFAYKPYFGITVGKIYFTKISSNAFLLFLTFYIR